MKIQKYNEAWLEKGLEYALKSWTSTFNRMGKPNPYSRIEKIIIGLIAEFAVEQFLQDIRIDYNYSGKTRWYEKDRYDIGIGNFEIDVKANFLDLKSSYIQKTFAENRNRQNWINTCIALVPLDQFNPSKSIRKKKNLPKVYIFPFIEGHFNENRMDDKYLVHSFWDYKWLKRAEHKNYGHLGKLKIAYHGNTTNGHKIIVYGTSKPKEFVKEIVNLNSENITTLNSFHQVFSIRFLGIPNGRLEIKSTNMGLTEVIQDNCKFELEKNVKTNKYIPSSNNWQNLRINKVNIYIPGWIDDEELRIIGRPYKRFDKTIPQYSEIKVDNWGCDVSELNDIKSIKKLL